ncbi:hypothetical protein [Sphingomonas phyllosphaerae]|nr:hypothetical protein [Sphingomonas phyllosphaerae]
MRAAFSYHRAIAPMMWMLVALMAVEMLVVHALPSGGRAWRWC